MKPRTKITRIRQSKAYKAVLTHRYTCPSWNLWSHGKPAPLCLMCFGGGLTVFENNIMDEFKLKKYLKGVD